ncbi:MAG TPA: hypothetical protein VEA19_05650 [Actinomycetota bacterium]|nr:hypothetical protein [Actinomycetota bacterium]
MTKRLAAGILGLTAALLLVAPASAGHKASHGGSQTPASVTEDDDSDGVKNNIPDDGDNAHPSGKDRSVEHGGSRDQGSSKSEPDQDGKGPERDTKGTDKPGGTGGADIYDQDGNNGCGNDDDFDDDNEGHCRRNRGSVPGDPVLPTLPKQDPPALNPPSVIPPEVLGGTLRRPGAQVLGITISREGAAARVEALAFTGGEVEALLAGALLLLITGATLLVLTRRGPAEAR